jgi:hypothetical protein
VGAAQQKLRLYQQLANLGNVDYYLMGRLDNHLDRTPYEGIREVFRFHHEHEADFRHLHSRAEVLLLRARLWEDASEVRGWVRALTENHILFDEAVERDVLAGELDRYKAIILPDSEQMSSALCQKLDAYAEKGGMVIAAGRVGRFDQSFAERPVPPLACLGVERILSTRDDMVSALFLLDPKEKRIFRSFRDVEAFAFGDTLTLQEYSPETQRFFTLLPPQPFGPPERCYGGEPLAQPGITVHPYGKGKGISIPFLIGTLYYKEGYENSYFLLRDVITSLCGIPSAAPDLTPMVEITLGVNDAKTHALVQLVNATGHFGTSYFEAVPVANVKVEIPLVEKVREATSLVDGRSISFEQSNGRVRLALDRVNDYESIKLALEPDELTGGAVVV